jgi:pimeloyl-ACP methyl ester carboxylesterase
MSAILWSVLGAAVAAGMLAIWLILRTLRRRRAAARLKIRSPNGIQEASFVRIGGIDQWVQIRGEDRSNPVLLVLHGGMAMSYIPQTEAFRLWEKHFTVVQWDRRGVGRTFGRNRAKGSGEMTLDRIAEDGLELAEHLRRRLGKARILLMGHSMGSQIGVMMAAKGPVLFHAYLATEQIVTMAENEAVTYRMILERLRTQGQTKAARKLERLGPPPYSSAMRWGVKQGMAERADPAYGAVLKEMGRRLVRYYSLKELIDFFAANQFCAARLFEQWMSFDARSLGETFDLPIVVIQGEDDLTAPIGLVSSWLEGLKAPHKRLVPLKAGHLSMVTHPEAFLEALVTQARPLTESRLAPAESLAPLS